MSIDIPLRPANTGLFVSASGKFLFSRIHPLHTVRLRELHDSTFGDTWSSTRLPIDYLPGEFHSR